MSSQHSAFRLKGFSLLLAVVFIAASALSAHAMQDGNEVTPAVEQLYAQARAASARGDTASAITKYRAMIKLAPHLAPAYNNLGMLYFNEHDYVHAAEVLRRGLDINPKMPTAVAMLGMSDFQLGEDQKAEPLLLEALRTDPKNDQVDMMLIQVLINGRKLEDASSRLRDFLARNPKDQQAWYLLGKTYLQMSENALGQVREIDPNSVAAHEIAGEIDASMHNYDLALVEYKKAVELAPKAPGTHMHMGDAYWYIGKWESAQSEFRAELENDPYNCLARWKLANSILEANDSSGEALKQLDLTIQRCPQLMQARVDRARALVRMDRQTEALPDLLMADKDSPSEPTIHFLLAAVYRAQGKSAEARSEMVTYSKLQREASAATAQQASEAGAIKNAAR